MLNLKKVKKVLSASLGTQFQIINPLDITLETGLSFDNKPTTLRGLTSFGTNINPRLGYLGTNGLNMISNIMNFKNLQEDEKMNTMNNILTEGSNILNNTIFSGIHNNDSPLTTGINNFVEQGSNFLPDSYKLGLNTMGLIGDTVTKLGLNTDQTNTTDKILGSKYLAGTPIGIVNSLGAKRTESFTYNKEGMKPVEHLYSSKPFEKASQLENKKVGLFSRDDLHKDNALIRDAKKQQRKILGIAKDSQDTLAMADNVFNYRNYLNSINNFFDPRHVLTAKYGARLKQLHVKKVPECPDKIDLEDTWEPIITQSWEPVIVLKDGGKVEKSELKNVIPEGNLHARLHHMENSKNITKKGIPVIDNKGELLAEIELNEIIFTLEVTEKLEQLYKEGTDEAAIKAGKLLVEEILFNTDDRTGLINTLKLGGKIE